MENTTSGINNGININGEKLETVTGLKYLSSVITDKIIFRIAQMTVALTKLKPVWKDKSIFFSSKL